MNYILFDGHERENLLPFTFTRPVAGIRTGILTIAEKWERCIKSGVSFLTQDYLQSKYQLSEDKDNILINGSVCPDKQLIEDIHRLNDGQALISGNSLIAVYLKGKNSVNNFNYARTDALEKISTKSKILKINNLWDIFSENDKAVRSDYALITEGRQSEHISPSNKIIGRENIFLEKGAKVECAVINASSGPVYIGKDAEVMEGSTVRGPFALCENSVLKMGAKIYGATTIGPYSKAGGEINNSVIFGYSNKAHGGFLGNSVIGEWCNIGAGTDNSNMKNDYSTVKLWNYREEKFVSTGLQFCGLMMGDHSKCGINTMFNTGTVVGVNANIFGAGFLRNFIPSFSWGGTSGFSVYKISKALEVAAKVMERRGKILDDTDKDILKKVFDMTLADLALSTQGAE